MYSSKTQKQKEWVTKEKEEILKLKAMKEIRKKREQLITYPHLVTYYG